MMIWSDYLVEWVASWVEFYVWLVNWFYDWMKIKSGPIYSSNPIQSAQTSFKNFSYGLQGRKVWV
jgi:hypothetical protein